MDYTLLGYKKSSIDSRVYHSAKVVEAVVPIIGQLTEAGVGFSHGPIEEIGGLYDHFWFQEPNLSAAGNHISYTAINGTPFTIYKLLYQRGYYGLYFNARWEPAPGFYPHDIFALGRDEITKKIRKLSGFSTLRTSSMRIDWGATLAGIKTSYPTHKIIGWDWEGIDTFDLLACNESYQSVDTGDGYFISNEHTYRLDDMLNSMRLSIKGESDISDALSGEKFFDVQYGELQVPIYNIDPVKTPGPAVVYVSGDPEGYQITYPGTITVYLYPSDGEDIISISEEEKSDSADTGEDSVESTVGGVEEEEPEDPNADGNGYRSVYGNGSSNKVTANTRLAAMTSGCYSKFVTSGGGIVSNNGAYANSKELYISSITRSMSGSKMSIIQEAKFDASRYFDPGDYIFGYIINKDGDYQPSFAGLVRSTNRKLTSGEQEIEYACSDLKGYFDQFCTPLVYRNYNWSEKQIADDLLQKVGIEYINHLPQVLDIDFDYRGESLGQVLDYLCSISGDYYYWIDENGILILDTFGTTVHSFAIPSEGSLVGTNKVLSWIPVTDYTNSRSRIVVTGANDGTYKTSHNSYIYDTGNFGGTLVYELALLQSSSNSTYTATPTWMLQYMAYRLADYYKPSYGGELLLDGLHTEIKLGDLVSLTGTSLSAVERSSLKVKEVHFDCIKQETRVTLANRLNENNIGISTDILQAQKDYFLKQTIILQRRLLEAS
jgi:hypothetical protein